MKWDLERSEPAIAHVKNPKTITRLIFNNILNTSYSVDHEPIENLEIGKQPTYKDYIKNALDPNVDSNANVYGIAKSLKPLTTRINEMRNSIDTANAAYWDLKKQVEQEQQAAEQPVVETPPAPPAEKGPDNV